MARFDGGTISSDGGLLLLRETGRCTGVLERFAACLRDHRDPSKVEHDVRELVSQRVLGLRPGYEDVGDHGQRLEDPLPCALSGKLQPGANLAGKSTLSRLLPSTGGSAAADRCKRIVLDTAAVDALLVEAFLESYDTAPSSIVLDLDATDFPLHGHKRAAFPTASTTIAATCPCTAFPASA